MARSQTGLRRVVSKTTVAATVRAAIGHPVSVARAITRPLAMINPLTRSGFDRVGRHHKIATAKRTPGLDHRLVRNREKDLSLTFGNVDSTRIYELNRSTCWDSIEDVAAAALLGYISPHRSPSAKCLNGFKTTARAGPPAQAFDLAYSCDFCREPQILSATYPNTLKKIIPRLSPRAFLHA